MGFMKLAIKNPLFTTVNQQFWRAVIFGEFGELSIFANICRRQHT